MEHQSFLVTIFPSSLVLLSNEDLLPASSHPVADVCRQRGSEDYVRSQHLDLILPHSIKLMDLIQLLVNLSFISSKGSSCGQKSTGHLLEHLAAGVGLFCDPVK